MLTTKNNHKSFVVLLLWATLSSSLTNYKQQVVEASGVFEINFSNLQDAYGRDLRQDYDCCQWQQQQQNETSSNQSEQDSCDPTKCQLIIRICVKNYQTMLESSQCTFGELTGQVMRPNEPVAQFAHYPSARPFRSLSTPPPWLPPAQMLPNNNRLVPVAASVLAQDRRLRRPQQQSQAANIHHQRMLFQQQQQQQQQASTNPKQALPASLPTGATSNNQQQQQMFQFVSSGQPRAMRTIAFDQPISFPFNFTWPGSFSLVVDAWFESPTGLQHKSLVSSNMQPQLLRDTYDIYRKQLIIRHSMHGWLPVKEEWTSDVRRSDEASLSYSYRVTCQPNYYGQQCNILCRPRDDVYGHYTCSGQGSIQCLPGWQGAYCLEPICSPGCHKDQGWCSRPNECQCRSGFRGPQCRECALYPGCVHGTCQKPHECTCREGWGGLLCDEDLNVCTNHKPCFNDAVCTNVFNDQGVGSYNCTCQPGFTGTNCEFSIDELASATTAATTTTLSTSTTTIQPPNLQQPREAQRNLTLTSEQKPPMVETENQPKIQERRHPKSPSQPQKTVLELTARASERQHDGVSTSSPYLQADSWLASLCALILGLTTVAGFLFLLHKALPEGYLYGSRRNHHHHHRHHQRRHHSQDHSNNAPEEVAHLQNQQNIYKSRTSLATDKVPFAGDGDSSSTLTSTASTSSSSAYQRWEGNLELAREADAQESLSRFQLIQLEREFQHNHHPLRARLDELARALKVDRHQIRRWFEARRGLNSTAANKLHVAGYGSLHAAGAAHRVAEQQPLYLHRSFHNLHLAGPPLPPPPPPPNHQHQHPPPPPYTISQSHASSSQGAAYMNMSHPVAAAQATYTTGSLYTPHLGPPHHLYASHHHLYGSQAAAANLHQSQHQLAAGPSAANLQTGSNPYGTHHQHGQSTATPYYVICHLLGQQQQQEALASSSQACSGSASGTADSSKFKVSKTSARDDEHEDSNSNDDDDDDGKPLEI